MSQLRFLADHDLNEHIVVGVRRREPTIEFLHVRDLGMNDKPDAEILEYADQQGTGHRFPLPGVEFPVLPAEGGVATQITTEPEIIAVAKRLFPLRDSAKYMNGRDLGRVPRPAGYPPPPRVTLSSKKFRISPIE